MNNDSECRFVAELAPELALGITGGEERARSVEHLAECASCRKLLNELSGLADDLLLLAPPREPPIGFETRVLERIKASRGPQRSRRKPLVAVAVAAALLLVVATAAAVFRLTSADRELASSYRRTLAVANGEYFSAEPLLRRGRESESHVFGYQGSPSWVFVVISEPALSGRFELRLETEQGRRLSLGTMVVRDGEGSRGRAIPVDYHDVEEITVSHATSNEVLEARL